MIQRIIITVVFGFVWWLCFNQVGAGFAWLMILGSVLAVCACCCRGGGEPERKFSLDRYQACLRRCWLATATLMIGLIILGIVVVLFVTGMAPAGVVWANILIASVIAPACVRLICCAYDS